MRERRVLFLCTGNYYRSRFAEHLFNCLAAEAGLDWRADSRALDMDGSGGRNVGPISPHALRGFTQRGMPPPAFLRYPTQLEEEDLRCASRVIALKEAEHRPMLQAAYPTWADRVEYWHVDDMDRATPEQALAEIEASVRQLIERLTRA